MEGGQAQAPSSQGGERLTNNNSSDRSSQISGKNVVWIGNDGNDDEIYLYNHDNASVTQLTDNNTVAWLSYEGEPNYRYYPDNAIYFYDGTDTTRLTDADSVVNEFDLSRSNLAWSDSDGKDSEIYLYDGTGVTQLTRNSLSESSPQIDGNNITWTGYEDNDSEIYRVINGFTTSSKEESPVIYDDWD